MANNLIPPAGTPGKFDPRNPTLIPNFDRNVVSDPLDPTMPPTVNHSSPAGYLAANARANASATATIGGTVTTGDILTIEMKNPVFPNGYLSHTYTTVGGDTVSTIAAQLAALFANDPVADEYGIEVTTDAAVMTFVHAGPVGNFSTLVAPNLEAAKVTIAGTALTGDEISILIASPNLPEGGVQITRAVTTGDSATTSAAALVASIGANAALVAAGITATNAAGVITFVVPPAEEPVTITTWVNTAAPTATIGGTVAVGGGDQVELVFTGTGITGSPVTVEYTTIAADTVTTIAAALVALINANAALGVAGIAATNAAGVISVTGFGGPIGQVRLTGSVPVGSETVTITTSPTTTSTASTAATETITFSPTTGIMSGGSGPVIAANNFEFAFGSSTSAFFYGQPYSLDYAMIKALVQQGMPIV